jgi:hypothetical protein
VGCTQDQPTAGDRGSWASVSANPWCIAAYPGGRCFRRRLRRYSFSRIGSICLSLTSRFWRHQRHRCTGGTVRSSCDPFQTVPGTDHGEVDTVFTTFPHALQATPPGTEPCRGKKDRVRECPG